MFYGFVQKSCFLKELGFFALHSVHQNALLEPAYAMIKWFKFFTFYWGVSFTNPYQQVFKNDIGEHQRVLESSGDTDLESNQFQFGCGTLTKIS